MRYPVIILILLITKICFSQNSSNNYVFIDPDETPQDIIKKAANVTPSQRQYEWQKMELTGFIHFGINTFEEVEWGHKGIDISKFNPTAINVKQWVDVFKVAGFKLIILTAKHHDGFCLWPSKYTDFDLANSPFQNGNGDIVRDLSTACREAGMRFGVYLSPWDMNEASYGTEEYNTYFRNQLTELLTNYGEISEVWFDGACGEGPNGKKQIYDWQSYYQLIRSLQPNAVIAVSGPDVRWVGTESGYGRQTEWSVLPGISLDQQAIAENSQQQAIDGTFVPRNLMDEDLGSREKLLTAKSLVWYPAEIDVSIRPGWFYHKSEDALVKSPQKLVDIYYNSIGLNGVLLLNIPPDKSGLITRYDVKSLKGMRYILDKTFKNNLAKSGKTTASSEKNSHEAHFILDDDLNTFWTTENPIISAVISVELDQQRTFNNTMLQENILVGQRIEKFHIDWWDGKQWQNLAEGTTIGFKRLLRFPTVTTNKIRIVIDASRSNPTLASFGLYEAPPQVKFNSQSNTFADSINIGLECESQDAKIYYSLDGTPPDSTSLVYSTPFTLYKSSQIKAFSISASGKKGLPLTRNFNKAKYSIDLKTHYSKKYAASGKLTLVDGVRGSLNFKDNNWLGFEGENVDVIIDLGKNQPVSKIGIGCLSAIKSYIFLPEKITVAFSADGKIFSEPVEIINSLNEQGKESSTHTFELKLPETSARFVRVTVKNIGRCPSWHPGNGAKAWLFVDEIIVE